jgi:hypothetical protein
MVGASQLWVQKTSSDFVGGPLIALTRNLIPVFLALISGSIEKFHSYTRSPREPVRRRTSQSFQSTLTFMRSKTLTNYEITSRQISSDPFEKELLLQHLCHCGCINVGFLNKYLLTDWLFFPC